MERVKNSAFFYNFSKVKKKIANSSTNKQGISRRQRNNNWTKPGANPPDPTKRGSLLFLLLRKVISSFRHFALLNTP